MKILINIVKKWGGRIIVAGGAIAMILSIYSFFSEKHASLSLQTVSEVNILNIHEPLKDLQILFRGEDIQENNLNLRIYTVKIENNGELDIKQNDFDQNDSWGIKIEDAKVIETRLVGTNSDYINENLTPQIHENGTVEFNKIIFDRKDFFIIEILVLHNKDIEPNLYQVGKISGIQEDNLEILKLEPKATLLISLFPGNWKVQIARFIVYFIISIAIIFGSLIFYIYIDDNRTKKRRSAQAPRVDEPASEDEHGSI